jgi:hypothetical protein
MQFPAKYDCVWLVMRYWSLLVVEDLNDLGQNNLGVCLWLEI